MAAAASGRFGTDVCPDYGLFPRALIGAFQEVTADRIRFQSLPGRILRSQA